MKKFLPFVLLILLSCDGQKELVLEHWANGNVKTKKIMYNERDSLQFLLLSYFSNGNQKERIQINGKLKNGWDICFYENGVVADSTFYRDNVPIATTVHFYPNGKKSTRGQFDDFGKRQGSWTVFDSTGRTSEKTDYASGAKMLTSYYDKTGQLTKELKYKEGSELVDEEKNYHNGVLHGPYKKYFDSGQLKKVGNYKHGSREGELWKEYHSSGKLFKEYLFIGNYDQSFKTLSIWDEDGKQKVKNGNGEYSDIEYCPDGKIKSTTKNKYEEGQVVDTKKTFGVCR